MPTRIKSFQDRCTSGDGSPFLSRDNGVYFTFGLERFTATQRTDRTWNSADGLTIIWPGAVTATDRAQGSIFFVGTATVVLRYAGFTILTDPNFLHAGDHVHLGFGMTATRRTDPALELESLPPVDFVILSHMHEDHFDREVERKLDRGLPIVTTPHAADELTSKGFRGQGAEDLGDPDRHQGRRRVRVTSMPGTHGPESSRICSRS